MSVAKIARTATVECPDCGDDITLELPVQRGELVNCPSCEAELEVIETRPVKLDWVYEDWEDEDQEDENW